MGPRRFHLCKMASEENEHLFIHCAFTKLPWQKIKSIKNIRHNWEGFDLDDCLTNWTKNKTNPTSLVALTCWYIWPEKNVAIFEGKVPSVDTERGVNQYQVQIKTFFNLYLNHSIISN